ncbi:hypothetical protein HYV81_01355 [Candidatus Woesearchaeota archaeon]|nr:hypothetical protein [Candidatus Woesearchaeota archaeon]
MGHFGWKPDTEGRPGADTAKRMKERRMGRDDTKAPQMHSIAEQKRRLHELEQTYSRVENQHTREIVANEYANLAASLAARCKPEVFSPTEIQGIERLSDLSDPRIVWGLDGKGFFPGSRPDFLPLHHIVKLIAVPVAASGYTQAAKGLGPDRFIYMLGSSSNDTPADPNARNLRGLEYFMLTFAYRMTEGNLLQAEVNGRRIQVSQSEMDIKRLRRGLDKASIWPSDHYTLRRIIDGNFKVQTPLHILADQRPSYKAEGVQNIAVLSYVTTMPPQKRS